MAHDNPIAVPEVLDDAEEVEAPSAFGAHLGGVGSVMLIAWHDDEHRFIALALRVLERTRNGRLVFEVPDREWLLLLDREYDVVCLTAQVGERFVSVEGTVDFVDRGSEPRVVIEPINQTFWDTISRRVARVTSDVAHDRERYLGRSAASLNPYDGS